MESLELRSLAEAERLDYSLIYFSSMDSMNSEALSHAGPRLSGIKEGN